MSKCNEFDYNATIEEVECAGINECLQIEIPVVVGYSISEGGIGSYEFWGHAEYDGGYNEATIEYVKPQYDGMKIIGEEREIPISEFTEEQIKALKSKIESYLECEELTERLIEAAFENCESQEDAHWDLKIAQARGK